MSIKYRYEVPGATYHVNANAVHPMSLFRDEVDRLSFFELLGTEAVRSGWTVLMYSMMTTHYHVLFTLKDPTLSSGFQRLQSMYAKRYNRRHTRRGVLWQKRFHDEIVMSDRHLYEAIRYIALNAPRAKMCELPEDWPWCSYGSALGVQSRDPIADEDALLGLFARDRATARRRLRAYVEESDPRKRWRQTRP